MSRARLQKPPFSIADEERTFVLLHILKKAGDLRKSAESRGRVGALTEAAELNLIHRYLMKLGNEIRNLEHRPKQKDPPS